MAAWEMPELCDSPHRLPSLTLIGLRQHDPVVVAIDDDGGVRWRIAGELGFVHDGVAWIGGHSRSAGYDAVSGVQLWSTTGVEPAHYPNRTEGLRPDDGHLLLEARGETAAFG